MDDRPEEPIQSPLGQLEHAFIDEYVRARGYDPDKLGDLPAPERNALLKEASIHASAKMAEVESRSHYVHEIHDTTPRGRRGGHE